MSHETNGNPPENPYRPTSTRPPNTDSPKNLWIAATRGLVGGLIGGFVGYLAYAWLLTQGFYSVILPGALLGLGFGLAAQYRSVAFGIVCAFCGLILGYFCEWKEFPFVADDSFAYFLTHVYQLKPVTQIMIVLGAVMAFWFGRGR